MRQQACCPIHVTALASLVTIVIVCSGSGKTMAFVIPILALLKKGSNVGFRACIVSPTRELANQVRLSVLLSANFEWDELLFCSR